MKRRGALEHRLPEKNGPTEELRKADPTLKLRRRKKLFEIYNLMEIVKVKSLENFQEFQLTC
jgi:hypothetical protein